MNLRTRLARVGTRTDPLYRSVATPIYQTAVFAHAGAESEDPFRYSRLGNPTRAALEAALADLEGARAAFAFASGMAAMTAVLGLFRPGDHLVVSRDLYGHTWKMVAEYFGARGITHTLVDATDPDQVAAAMGDRTAAVLVEPVTNPTCRVVDLPALARLCRERSVLLIVDNTFLTPYLLRPLELGAHVVVHSASKYLSGHNDVVAGAVAVRSPALAEELAFMQQVGGAILGPQDSWLLIRGLKTLALRLDRAQEGARAVAAWLAAHPAVAAVHYPGLPSDPGHQRLMRQAAGAGALLSFRLKDPALVPALLDSLQLILYAESLGGCETLITHPARQTHRDMPPELRAELGIDDGLLRLAVGIEDPADLIADLDQALQRAMARAMVG